MPFFWSQHPNIPRNRSIFKTSKLAQACVINEWTICCPLMAQPNLPAEAGHLILMIPQYQYIWTTNNAEVVRIVLNSEDCTPDTTLILSFWLQLTIFNSFFHSRNHENKNLIFN